MARSDTPNDLQRKVSAQKAAYFRSPYPTAEARKAHLRALADMLLRGRRRIVEAMRADYGVHPDVISDIVEVAGPVMRAQSAIANLDAWMTPEVRPSPGFGAATATMSPMPKGVAGIMAPWNFPFDLTCGPLVDMLAAGNRVMIKPSEITAACADVLADLIAETFEPEHVTTAIGGPDIAKIFPSLGFDHLLYTGSTQIGREVMRAAAEHLTPVTLELGGKSPAVLLEGGLTTDAIQSIVGMKLVKSGQVCVSVDHVITPRSQLRQTVEMIRDHYRQNTPHYSQGPDCTAIVSDRHTLRLQRLLDEARAKGVEVISLEEDLIGVGNERRMPLHLVVAPPDDLELSREEIFGPILPILPHDGANDVIGKLQAGGRPLGLYLFGSNEQELERIGQSALSGGLTFNGAGHHAACPTLAFGGVGTSGMGQHHYIDGFREFSHYRATFKRDLEDGGAMSFLPPYGERVRAELSALFASLTSAKPLA